MTRIEAIARLRELADKLEAAGDAPHDVTSTGIFSIGLGVHVSHDRDSASYWTDALGCSERRSFSDTDWYCTADGSDCHSDVSVYCPAGYRHIADTSDLLANRDVQVIEIGGAA